MAPARDPPAKAPAPIAQTASRIAVPRGAILAVPTSADLMIAVPMTADPMTADPM